ncbi:MULTISPECIES: phage holin family protein [unclassified Aeromicrobium]|jgi:putative membrane protein|uniref:phage holin family protein n=1 Tax=unclassified Aeromicrobium TaxID=2633570 RepID=UPI000B0D4742|nr:MULTISPECIES: phage holin family protein [unclassified Aeromicrobium]MCO7240132.1 phage holin family protein [Aeromicrobium sp. CnD17-E]MDR6117962.1 putative membrane protein [Aeromicrobium sp. SORGH_AS_0981]
MLSRLLTSWVLGAAALATAAWLLGTHMSIGTATDTTSERLVTLAVVAAIFAVVNTFVAPVIKLLSLPFIILTLGLLLVVINAVLLLLTSRIADALNAPFFIDGFGWAVLASIVISVVNAVLGSFAED